MMSLCKYLRKTCNEHEKIANAAMLVATGMFGGTLTFFIFYQQEILGWVRENPFLHPIMIGGLVMVEVFMIFIVTRLVFTDCREEAARHGEAYIGPRSHPMSAATSWVEKLGTNPKRL